MQKPVVAGWNKPTREYYEVPNARQSKPLSRTKIHGVCVLILAVVFGWQGCVMQGSVLYMTLVMYTLVDHYGVDTRAARRISQSRGFPKVLATSTVRGRRDLYDTLLRLNRPSSCTYRTLLLRLIPVCTDHRLALVCPSLRCCSRTFAVSDFSSVEEASMVRLIGCERSASLQSPEYESLDLRAAVVYCRESKLSNLQRKLLGIPVSPEDSNAPLRHRLTQPTQAKPAPQPIKSPLGAPNVSYC